MTPSPRVKDTACFKALSQSWLCVCVCGVWGYCGSLWTSLQLPTNTARYFIIMLLHLHYGCEVAQNNYFRKKRELEWNACKPKKMARVQGDLAQCHSPFNPVCHVLDVLSWFTQASRGFYTLPWNAIIRQYGYVLYRWHLLSKNKLRINMCVKWRLCYGNAAITINKTMHSICSIW